MQENKRTVIPIFGSIILILGIIVYFISAPKMDAMKSFWGQLSAGLNSQTATEFQLWQFAYYGSIVAIILGVVLIIVGVVIKASQEK